MTARRWVLVLGLLLVAALAATAQAETLAHKAALYDALFTDSSGMILCL